ncbi:hypothetical protein BU23DRAFT_282840 [Bimuria novae-zelandiae CBS 107.79]|uniref:F-box domain-containing protein n=1 Tax=Bimuria novae-zelandiae CBS 107.79 TaxID=1447943 RepID=A0A6A5UT66_9PLEO|nr:hypothetical protein BU23DRAFT_282840 [Bimuria novae-zelandiae CBS 107.79]
MSTKLDRLPFDVLFYVTSHLGVDDIVNLAHTCRQLKTLLQENGVCRNAIESRFQFTKEANLAQVQRLSYCEAFSCIQDRRNAFANAHPFSARVIGQCNDFLYREGMLCILQGNIIRTLDMHAQTEGVTIDIASIVVTASEPSSSSTEFKASLLYYNEDIVAIHWELKDQPNSDRIVAINTKLETPNERRLVRSVQLESNYKIFARHTSHYLFYGTYTSVGSQGHYEWEVQGISLDRRNYPLSCNTSLQLRGFFGTDIGSTIAFEIHNGYFYAVSNQTSFEVEEIDWTSFYHCIRFPIDNPKIESLKSNKKLWRRQHSEGVIHDSWTDLSLQVDEDTDNLMIVEARREYQKSCSRQVRTYYISEFISSLNSPTSSADGSPILEATAGPMLPWGDAYVQTLDSTNNPNYAPEEPRYNWNFHPEVPRRVTPGRSFILARTKLRAYNYACSSFLDLVEDESCCNDPSTSCLRLRMGSRRVAPSDWKPLEDTIPQLLSPPAQPDDVAYRHFPIKMWPPPASRCPCSRRLHQILNPPLPGGPAYSKSITGTLDERSLVYMIRPGRSGEYNALGVIVMISFNRGPVPPRGTQDRSHEQAQNESEWHWTPGACRSGTCQ